MTGEPTWTVEPRLCHGLSSVHPHPLGSSDDCPECWETCAKCKEEFVAGHICRTHRLCGICHWPL